MRKILFCILTTAALSLAAGKPPTVASVKAMSVIDLDTSLSDTEGMMLENARHSVPDTLSAMIRINNKHLAYLRSDDGQRHYAYAYIQAHPGQCSNEAIDKAYGDFLYGIKKSTVEMLELLAKLEKKSK